jgi:queuine tRNA-ribosyltransferase
MLPQSVRATGAEIVLGNTYHLMLRPTAERIAKLGGLHKFMHWDGPILTDSGGFQVMSLAKLRKITDHGVTFKSHLDGTALELTPERSMKIQTLLGADIAMVLDECTPLPATKDEVARSMQLSLRWAERSKYAFREPKDRALFGIVQGGLEPDLRAESVDGLVQIGFDGYAIGGLSVGEGQDAMFRVLDVTAPLMPADQPRYLMGVGKPADLIGAVARGVDMFDCVLPTRSGRTGQAFTRRGPVNIKNACHREDPRPLDDQCKCPACRDFSRAYLNHLHRSNEILGAMLLTWHNLQYYQDLMEGLRFAIDEGKMAEFVKEFEFKQAAGDINPI